MKVVQNPSNYNMIEDGLLQKNKDQPIPKKLLRIMEYKKNGKQTQENLKESKKTAKRLKTVSVKTGDNNTIEKGMTRATKSLPTTVEKGILENDYQFLNRIDKMVSKAMAEAKLEEHFDVDLLPKIKDNNQIQNGKKFDKTSNLLVTESEKLEKRKQKRKIKDAKRKEKKSKKQNKLKAEFEELSFRKDKINFGEILINCSSSIIEKMSVELTSCGEGNDHIASNSKKSSSSYDDEELDYEEEIEDLKGNSNLKNDNDEEGEIIDNDDSIDDRLMSMTKHSVIDKDEGELDDDDLEEGEVKEEGEVVDDVAMNEEANPETVDNGKERPKIMAPTPEARKVLLHDPDIRRHGRSNNYNNWQNSNQGYNHAPRYNYNRVDRYGNVIRSTAREPSYHNHQNTPAQQLNSESAWERGIKQARKLLSEASKRKEVDTDFDHKRCNLTLDNATTNVGSIEKPVVITPGSPTSGNITNKRARYSGTQHSSSEDEVERRHRLAYDAAPWNNQATDRYGNIRPNYGSTNRSAETYRDPWRRSKSPKPAGTRSRGSMVNDRYHERSKQESRRSNSMSSLSSILSEGSDASGGRKLPYSRPNLESRTRFDRDNGNDLSYKTDIPKSRMDRIPKKPNASYQTKDRVSEAKSFDSWSESLSDSDSSSFFSDSDSDDSDTGLRNKSQTRKKSQADKRTGSKSHVFESNLKSGEVMIGNKKPNKESGSSSMEIHKRNLSGGKISRNNLEKEMKKTPIKMTFMKTQTSLKKDKTIDEQLNGELFEDQFETNNSRSSAKFSSGSKSNAHSDDDAYSLKSPILLDDALSSSSSNNNSGNRLHRREELLLKLKAVEDAIERKLGSKKD
ncbi:hypothetical protein RDWZM_005072 [Blomia tropicalis]|uniref:Uncharacterized protein n=1 Tax=Blomia tropicalis TaxID=40697 RepID=A0A9Q0M8N4_BLOTA|nr:hypothetical protein RDWZM_005072 [Blomia tropicalis]